MTDETKLLPCPFCGCEPEPLETTVMNITIRCSNRKCRATIMFHTVLDMSATHDAIEAWNRREPSD